MPYVIIVHPERPEYCTFSAYSGQGMVNTARFQRTLDREGLTAITYRFLAHTKDRKGKPRLIEISI